MKIDAQKIIDGFLFGLGAGAGYALFEFILTKL